jgi:hypothetical protein
MPFFKSTYNILTKQDEDEVFDPNWMDSDKLVLPPKVDWDYARELQIEDIDLWEVLYEGSGGLGVYAAWLPYAEFYLVTTGFTKERHVIKGLEYNGRVMETYYGVGTQERLQKRIKELGLPIQTKQVWVEPKDMWLYETYQPQTLIIP